MEPIIPNVLACFYPIQFVTLDSLPFSMLQLIHTPLDGKAWLSVALVRLTDPDDYAIVAKSISVCVGVSSLPIPL